MSGGSEIGIWEAGAPAVTEEEIDVALNHLVDFAGPFQTTLTKRDAQVLLHHYDALESEAEDAQSDSNAIEQALFPHVQGRDLPEILSRISALADALTTADFFLLHLSGWDMLNPPDVTADGPYWQQEILLARQKIASATADFCPPPQSTFSGSLYEGKT